MSGPAIALGGAALGIGALAFGVSLGAALRGSPAPTAVTHGNEGPTTVAVPVSSSTPNASVRRAETVGPGTIGPEVLDFAVESAPFQPDREAPSDRYRLPDDALPPAPTREEPPEAPEFRLLGAVASGVEGWVVIQVEDEDPRMLRRGDQLQGYTLAAVRPDVAVMVGEAGAVELRVPDPATTAPVQRGRNQREGPSRTTRSSREDRSEAPAWTPTTSLEALAAQLESRLTPQGREMIRLLGLQGVNVDAALRRFQTQGGDLGIDGEQLVITGPTGDALVVNGTRDGPRIVVARGLRAP